MKLKVKIKEKNTTKPVYEEWKLSKEDNKDVMKEIARLESSLMIDSEYKGYSDIQMIDNLFPKLSKKEKLAIFYYGHWASEKIYRKLKIIR
jgi:hypothetical protein